MSNRDEIAGVDRVIGSLIASALLDPAKSFRRDCFYIGFFDMALCAVFGTTPGNARNFFYNETNFNWISLQSRSNIPRILHNNIINLRLSNLLCLIGWNIIFRRNFFSGFPDVR